MSSASANSVLGQIHLLVLILVIQGSLWCLLKQGLGRDYKPSVVSVVKEKNCEQQRPIVEGALYNTAYLKVPYELC